MKRVAIVGAGPAGLMAAEVLAGAGLAVTVYERMPSVGRKFLLAGRGGLNLTHGEDFERLIARYGASADWLRPAISTFPPKALRAWCEGLGVATFVGSSGRVFPAGLKASPLLRAWLRRLDGLGVRFVLRRRWTGWDDAGALLFAAPDGQVETMAADAVVLALGGASWPRTGSDGGWVDIVQSQCIPVTPLRPANCGFAVPWSEPFKARFAGQPLKPVIVAFGGTAVQGELMITARGLEGGALYAVSAAVRDAVSAEGSTTLTLDLRPGVAVAELAQRLGRPRGSQSLSTFLRKAGGLSPLAIALVREVAAAPPQEPAAQAALIKALPLRLGAPGPLERAISTAGGIAPGALDERFMLRARPGVFAAGEMLDWEAPTGGYLLQGAFSTGAAAARGVLGWLGWLAGGGAAPIPRPPARR